MPVFMVWDELNGSREDAFSVDALDAEDAAKEYAEQDSDGLNDGLYTHEFRELHNLERQGQPISVELPETGEHWSFKVGVVEFEAVWGAHEVSWSGSIEPKEQP